jgi:hypothetical protein
MAAGMPEDFGRHYRDAMLVPGRTAAALRLGWTLIDLAYTQHSTTVVAGYRYLEHETHLQRRSLQRARDELVDAGTLVVTSPQPGAHGRTRWRLVLPDDPGAHGRPPSVNGAELEPGAHGRPPEPSAARRPNPFLEGGRWTGRAIGRASAPTGPGPEKPAPAPAPGPEGASRARARDGDLELHVDGAGAGAGESKQPTELEPIAALLLGALPARTEATP